MAGRATRKAAACNGAGESERTTRRGPEVHERERAVVLGRRGGCSEARAGDVRSGAAWRRVRRGRRSRTGLGPTRRRAQRAAPKSEVAGRRDALDVPTRRVPPVQIFFLRPSRLALFSKRVPTVAAYGSPLGAYSHTPHNTNGSDPPATVSVSCHAKRADSSHAAALVDVRTRGHYQPATARSGTNTCGRSEARAGGMLVSRRKKSKSRAEQSRAEPAEKGKEECPPHGLPTPSRPERLTRL